MLPFGKPEGLIIIINSESLSTFLEYAGQSLLYRDAQHRATDNDHSTWSSRLIQKLSASQYFHLSDVSPSYSKAIESVEAGDADFIIEIEPGFERNLVKEGVSQVMISANAVNGVKAGLGSSYLSQIVADYSAQLREESGLAVASAVSMAHYDVVPRYLYNTTLDYKMFMAPGLMAMLLILLVGFLPAMNIVGEKEKGTIEQINVTPVGKFDFILSKLIPYWVVGLFVLAYAMVLARLIYGQVPEGNIGVIFLFATLFILVVSSMPEWAKAFTRINPLRYFIEAMRTLYLKGSSLYELRHHFYALSVYATAMWIWAIGSYKKNS